MIDIPFHTRGAFDRNSVMEINSLRHLAPLSSGNIMNLNTVTTLAAVGAAGVMLGAMAGGGMGGPGFNNNQFGNGQFQNPQYGNGQVMNDPYGQAQYGNSQYGNNSRDIPGSTDPASSRGIPDSSDPASSRGIPDNTDPAFSRGIPDRSALTDSSLPPVSMVSRHPAPTAGRLHRIPAPCRIQASPIREMRRPAETVSTRETSRIRAVCSRGTTPHPPAICRQELPVQIVEICPPQEIQRRRPPRLLREMSLCRHRRNARRSRWTSLSEKDRK